jgi:hypothetical protein
VLIERRGGSIRSVRRVGAEKLEIMLIKNVFGKRKNNKKSSVLSIA